MDSGHLANVDSGFWSKSGILVSTLLRGSPTFGPNTTVHIGQVSTAHTSETYLITGWGKSVHSSGVSTQARCPHGEVLLYCLKQSLTLSCRFCNISSCVAINIKLTYLSRHKTVLPKLGIKDTHTQRSYAE